MADCWRKKDGVFDEPVHRVERIKPFRLETWSDGDSLMFLAAWSDGEHVTIRHLVLDRATGAMRDGEAAFHQDAATLRLPRLTLVGAVALEPLPPVDFKVYALPHPGHRVREMDELPLVGMIRTDITHGSIDADALRNATSLSSRAFALDSFPVLDAGRGVEWGYPHVLGRFRDKVAEPVAPPQGLPCPEAFLRTIEGAGLLSPDEVTAQIAKAVAEALAPFHAFFGMDLTDCLARSLWTPRSHMFFAAPGEAGERRRQAARLYRAFAPVFAHDMELGRLVDRGVPYEDRLAAVVATWSRWGAYGCTAALIRRYRGYRGLASFNLVARTLQAASTLPVDWLPETPEGWNDFEDTVLRLFDFAATNALHLEDLVRPAKGDWPRFRAGLQEADALAALRDSGDIAERLRNTLLNPILWSMLPEAEASDVIHRISHWVRQLAGKLLFTGKTVHGVAKLSRHWHANLHRLEGHLPRRADFTVWPALTDAYRHPGGVEVVPLTSVAALMAEGARGPDADGVEGLAHCVGGYGRQCYAGACHIYSVRRPLPDGGFERLSTLEVQAGREGDPQLILDGPDLRVGTSETRGWTLIQHRGRSNGSPPPEAVQAVEGFMAALNDPRGPLAVNPEASEGRSEAEFDKATFMTAPEDLDRALAAWAPYLPREVVQGGVEGLAGRLREVMRQRLGREPDQEERFQALVGDVRFAC